MISLPLYDVHEPNLMKSLLAPTGFEEDSLNEQGWADYRWSMGGVAYKPYHHVERKTWGELSDLDAVEEQLFRHIKNHERDGAKLTWILEGVVTPTVSGYVIYKEASSKGRVLFVPAHQQHKPLKMLHAWLYRIGQFVEVHYTSCVIDTANLLVAMYQNDQKAEADHDTFARYYKSLSWNPNPQVAKLIAIGDGIGTIRAQAIIERFGTVYNVLQAQPEHLASVSGIGMVTAKKLLQRIGRTDV